MEGSSVINTFLHNWRARVVRAGQWGFPSRRLRSE